MESVDKIKSASEDNETRGINEPIGDFIRAYKTFSKAGAESIIDQCETVVKAKDVLSDKPFQLFLLEVDLKENSSTYRKMRKIGLAASRFKAVLDKMPNEWTTLYALAVLDNEVFMGLVNSGVVKRSMTAKSLKEALGKAKIEHEDYKITISLDGCTLGQQYELANIIQANVASYSAATKFSKALETRLEEYKSVVNDMDNNQLVEA